MPSRRKAKDAFVAFEARAKPISFESYLEVKAQPGTGSSRCARFTKATKPLNQDWLGT